MAEIEGELEHADQCVSEYAKEGEQNLCSSEMERLRQERERDAATIEKLKRELDEEKKRLSVPGYEYECY